jgi:hypothetical protein
MRIDGRTLPYVLREWRERRWLRKLRKAAAEREAMRVARRVPLEDLDPLVRKLVDIGSQRSFLQARKRVRAIGAKLYREGGQEAMVDAYELVDAWIPAAELSAAWDGLGDWRH